MDASTSRLGPEGRSPPHWRGVGFPPGHCFTCIAGVRVPPLSFHPDANAPAPLVTNRRVRGRAGGHHLPLPRAFHPERRTTGYCALPRPTAASCSGCRRPYRGPDRAGQSASLGQKQAAWRCAASDQRKAWAPTPASAHSERFRPASWQINPAAGQYPASAWWLAVLQLDGEVFPHFGEDTRWVLRVRVSMTPRTNPTAWY